MEQLENELEDDELYFRRFAPEKQDSIRALVSYTTLLGLDGKDLISIGGRLDRLKVKRERESNKKIVLAMDIRAVGKDKDLRHRWAYITPDGTRYYFDQPSYDDVRVRNAKSGVVKTVNYHEYYDVARVRSLHHHRYLANIMLNVYYGNIKLNF